MKPLVSVIIRTKDRPLLLRRAIRSVLDQSFEAWEIQLINNGGDSNLVKAIVQEFDCSLNDRLHIIHLKKAYDMEVATNIGIKNSNGEYIALLDDDDTWSTDFLNFTIQELENDKRYAGVATQTNLVYEKIINDEIVQLKESLFNPSLRHVTLFKLARKNLFTTNAFVYKKSALETIGVYREDLPVLGDWEFNIRFVCENEVKIISDSLAFYHKRVDTDLNEYGNSKIINHLYWDWKIRKEYLKKNPWNLGFLMISFGMLNAIVRNIKSVLYK
ncbi:glycosyltransferase [Paenibacillus sp. MMS20-IR301]|uniref:glycosyltransferase n=1 Tax=Paenibacillus sp. MMS20-IR301 TaxID=2895946 RepID=UPI0028F0068D|nr:glycosyltransferase [Paenibacillus sp. MMS20-IR301]WNS42734.1 glycosyltransferase [Paenibacillus sp. MMS20-IR301]